MCLRAEAADVIVRPETDWIRAVKTLITGIGRSGTSALYFKLQEALPPTTWCLFEPHALDPSALDASPDVLAKILIGMPYVSDPARLRAFDKKILMVRDPRDNLVSRLLYRPCGTAEIRRDEAKVAAFVETLRGKEADPRSISMQALFELTFRLCGPDRPDRSTALQALALDFHRNNDGFVVYKYEDFIAGRYSVIEDHLGIRLPDGEVQVSAAHHHTVRTKASDGWRHWFTADDVNYFAPRLAPFMAAYGYADDWTLAAEPQISAEHSSDFVRRSVAIRRQQDRDAGGS
jgi:hypothetical protein